MTNFFSLLGYSLLIVLLISTIPILLKTFLNLRTEDIRLAPIYVCLSMITIGPFMEELIFRLILKPTYSNLICIFLLLSYFAFILARKHYTITLLLVLLLAIFIVFILCNKKIRWKVQYIFIKRFTPLFYLSCISFGLIHLLNYSNFSTISIILSPILILPQIVAGAFMGFVRMKYGIFFSILFHSLYNIIPALLLITQI